jgi:hypothetical protein
VVAVRQLSDLPLRRVEDPAAPQTWQVNFTLFARAGKKDGNSNALPLPLTPPPPLAGTHLALAAESLMLAVYRRREFVPVSYYTDLGDVRVADVAVGRSLRLFYFGESELYASQAAFGFDTDPLLPSTAARRGGGAGPPPPSGLDTGFSDDSDDPDNALEEQSDEGPPSPSAQLEQVGSTAS